MLRNVENFFLLRLAHCPVMEERTI